MLRDHLDISECTRTKCRQDNQLDLAVMAELVASAVMVELVAVMAELVAMAVLGVLVQVNTW